MINTTLCYIERDGQYLMLHRVKKQNDLNHDKWIGVGGKFEPLESPEDCLLREVREETGLTLTRWRYRGIVTFVSGDQGEYMHLFTADGFTGQLKDCDEAAERVCRMCSQWESCWNQNAQETVAALDRAAPAMMTRGKALREDLPPLFVNRCRHLEGFLTAVNRELDDLSCRRQCRSRIRESREILARQYGALSRALSREQPSEQPVCRFRPEVGFRSQSRRGDVPSGDRAATFRLGKYFYLLLCDGMGTGESAAGEAGAAIAILRTLLQAGVRPQEAMELLNGIYILRDDGGFSTVDLLQADLTTGEVTLLKWGSAVSYIKRRSGVEKIGTASPPPGIGIGEEFRPEETTLSLGRGDLLVLLSDGAGGETAERYLRQCGGLSPKELAAGLIGCGQKPEDDRTAAVLALQPS